jgi:8-oxo-dGTP pyrophosphatase MutT (NUDIX family)
MDHSVSCRHIGGEYRDYPAVDLVFRPAAYGVIGRESELLLVFFPEFDSYTIPGGGMGVHELAADTVRREVLEETGYEVEVGELLHFRQEFFFHPHSLQPCNSLSLFFLCRVGEEVTPPTIPDYSDARVEWVDVSQPRTDLHMFIQPVVEKYRELMGLA